MPLQNCNTRLDHRHRTRTRMPRSDRYTTALALPAALAQHVAAQADRRGISKADFIRLLIAADMGLRITGKRSSKA